MVRKGNKQDRREKHMRINSSFSMRMISPEKYTPIHDTVHIDYMSRDESLHKPKTKTHERVKKKEAEMNSEVHSWSQVKHTELRR